MVVTFQDYFKNDEVNLSVNRIYVFKAEVLSFYTLGVTDVEVVFIRRGKYQMVTTYGKQLITTKYKSILLVSLNGRINKFAVDLRSGKYVGLSKKAVSQFEIRQSSKPFIYG